MRKRKKRGGIEWVQSWEREKGRENRNQKYCMGKNLFSIIKKVPKWKSNNKIMSYK